jgi:hypothetical protein
MSNALMSDSVTPSLPNHSEKSSLVKLQQSLTEADQQAKILHLQAEVESLWQKVQRTRMDN